MQTVGLDLSLSCTGIAVVEDGKVIHTDRVHKSTEFVSVAHRAEAVAFKVADHKPSTGLRAVVIENTYHGPNPKVSIALAEFRGMVMGSLHAMNIRNIYRPLPSEWKAWATGNGAAKKLETMGIVETWGYEVPWALTDTGKDSKTKKDDNIADAICIAQYGWSKLNGPIEGIGLERLMKR